MPIQVASQEAKHVVAVYKLACLIDKDNPVRITVESHAEISLVILD